MWYVNTRQRFSVSFSELPELRWVLQNSTTEISANISQVVWDGIRATKFEIVQIHRHRDAKASARRGRRTSHACLPLRVTRTARCCRTCLRVPEKQKITSILQSAKSLVGFQPITFHCEKDWKKNREYKVKKNSKLTVFIINMGVQKVPRLNGYMKVIWKALTHGTTIWRKDLEIRIRTASSI